jgi:tRNA threonylcarbamoyladenosine dehydratase
MRSKDQASFGKTGRKFDRVARLYGDEGLARLKAAHLLVVGLGGVGSWAAEAAARSGVGRLTLVDFDTVCVRNFNRQLQALDGNVGRLKAEVLAERLRLITDARVEAVTVPLTDKNCAELLRERPVVIDAIDHVTSKCFLIAYCRREKIPLVVSTGSGGRKDPTQVRITDLGRTEMDPLARAVRKILKSKYGFPRDGKYGIACACSLEKPQDPHVDLPHTDCKAACVCPQGENDFNCCSKKSVVLGTSCPVTAAFGLACAAEAVRLITQPKI